MEDDDKSVRHRLKEAIDRDISDRKEWETYCRALEDKRISANRPKKTTPFPGAANFVVPIVDNSVNEKTSQEMAMLFNAKFLCYFKAMRPEHEQLAMKAAYGFDWFLRCKMRVRAKLEEIVDKKNCIGMGLAKRVWDEDAGCMGFMPIDPYEVIVPWETSSLKDPERVCHVIRLTERELLDRGLEKRWKNTEDIVKRATAKHDSGLVPPAVGRDFRSDAEYELWEVYHWRKAGTGGLFGLAAGERDEKGVKYAGSERWVTVMSPDFPDLEIMDYPYTDYRVWPFVQFRDEGRSSKWYDVRGAAHKTIDNQLSATAAKNAKCNSLSYHESPLFTGNIQNAGNMRFSPGSILPDGLKPVQMPQIPAQFDYEINQEEDAARKRIGVQGQALSTSRPGFAGEAKTATEVATASDLSGMFNSNSVAAFNEPLQRLFELIWQGMGKEKVEFLFGSPENSGMFDKSMYDASFWLIPAGTCQTASPMRYLAELRNLVPELVQFPNVKTENIPALLVGALSPGLVSQLVYDPTQGGGGVPPMIPQMQQQGQQVQQLAQVVQEIGNAMKAMGEDVVGTKDAAVRNEEALRELSDAIMKIVGGAQSAPQLAGGQNVQMR